MGIYSDRVFPWIIDQIMDREVMAEQRRVVLADAVGDVLEIGFGTGLNLPHYPSTVRHLTVLDPNAGMHRRAAKRMRTCAIPLHAMSLGADGDLPSDNNQYDTIVSTWTMCSIGDLRRALAELARVLKPGGKLLFVEHGLSPDEKIARWQNRMNGFNKWIGDGCHLNRNIADFIASSPLSLDQCEQFYLPSTPRVGGWIYRGTASKRDISPS